MYGNQIRLVVSNLARPNVFDRRHIASSRGEVFVHGYAGVGVLATAPEARQGVPPAASKPSSREFVIVCTFLKDVPRGLRSEPPRVPITEDPRFVVTARVERIERGASPWTIGTILNFIIHSPALMFGGRAPEGKRFVLTFSPLRPTTRQDRIWFDPATRYLLQKIEQAG